MTYQHTQAAGLEQLIPPPVEHDREVFLASHPISEFPDVPKMIIEAKVKAKRFHREDELCRIGIIIKNASLLDCKYIIGELVDRVSTLVGSASKLEDAHYELVQEIKSRGENE